MPVLKTLEKLEEARINGEISNANAAKLAMPLLMYEKHNDRLEAENRVTEILLEIEKSKEKLTQPDLVDYGGKENV